METQHSEDSRYDIISLALNSILGFLLKDVFHFIDDKIIQTGRIAFN